MRYNPLPNSLFIKNRQKLVKRLNKNSMALLCSNDVLPTNADGVMGFKQNSDLFYLTGIDQEETYLFFFQIIRKRNTEKCFLFERLTTT